MVSFVDLIGLYYQKRKHTLEDIARDLNSCIVDPGEHYTRSAIHTWIHGTNKPKYSMLEHIYNHAPVDSWQRQFALTGMELITGKNGGQTDKCPAQGEQASNVN